MPNRPGRCGFMSRGARLPRCRLPGDTSPCLRSSSWRSAAPAASAKNQAVLDSFETGVFQKLNQTRADHGLTPLKLSVRLTSASNVHSVDMATNGYFDHSSRDGTPFWKRVDHWYGSSGYTSWSVGENILWSSPSVTPARAVAALDGLARAPRQHPQPEVARGRDRGRARERRSRRLPRAAGDGHHDRFRRSALTSNHAEAAHRAACREC